jgi:hypothetical protein
VLLQFGGFFPGGLRDSRDISHSVMIAAITQDAISCNEPIVNVGECVLICRNSFLVASILRHQLLRCAFSNALSNMFQKFATCGVGSTIQGKINQHRSNMSCRESLLFFLWHLAATCSKTM